MKVDYYKNGNNLFPDSETGSMFIYCLVTIWGENSPRFEGLLLEMQILISTRKLRFLNCPIAVPYECMGLPMGKGNKP